MYLAVISILSATDILSKYRRRPQPPAPSIARQSPGVPTPSVSRLCPCKIRHLPLDYHLNSGVIRQF